MTHWRIGNLIIIWQFSLRLYRVDTLVPWCNCWGICTWLKHLSDTWCSSSLSDSALWKSFVRRRLRYRFFRLYHGKRESALSHWFLRSNFFLSISVFPLILIVLSVIESDIFKIMSGIFAHVEKMLLWSTTITLGWVFHLFLINGFLVVCPWVIIASEAMHAYVSWLSYAYHWRLVRFHVVFIVDEYLRHRLGQKSLHYFFRGRPLRLQSLENTILLRVPRIDCVVGILSRYYNSSSWNEARWWPRMTSTIILIPRDTLVLRLLFNTCYVATNNFNLGVSYQTISRFIIKIISASYLNTIKIISKAKKTRSLFEVFLVIRVR